MTRHDAGGSGRLGLLCCAALLCLVPPVSADATEDSGDSPRVLHDAFSSVSLLYYANHGDDFRALRYVGELGLEMDFGVYAVADASDFRFDLRVTTGLGESQTTSLPFALNEISYRFGPFFEQRMGGALYRFGYDHSCSHLVFSEDAVPWYVDARTGRVLLDDFHYNRLFLFVGSDTSRPHELRKQIAGRATGAACRRYWWSLELGYYLRDFFDWVDRSSLNEGNNWRCDVAADVAVALWRTRFGDLFARNSLWFLADTEDHDYWRDRVGVDFFPSGGGLGTSWFINRFVYDEHPRDGHKDMVSLGFRTLF